MILGQISYLDIAVFLVFLAPQLILNVGLFSTIACALQALPFLFIKLPLSFIYEHVFLRQQDRSPFVQQASFFEDIVIRCVRYAFANIPAKIGSVFFSKSVALPFLRFRMLRHGYLKSPYPWRVVEQAGFKGILITFDPSRKPDVVVYYAHGGGFSMGSSYFYLEFLLSWTHLLRLSGFANPAILALEYTLVPTACHPTQLNQAVAGYKYILANLAPTSRICVSGDSAGATIMLSLLLLLSRGTLTSTHKIPAMAVLISPWTTLISKSNRDTASDYLDRASLELYARQYAGNGDTAHDSVLSPGVCRDTTWWRRATPARGFFLMWGREEVFAPEIRNLVGVLLRAQKEGLSGQGIYDDYGPDNHPIVEGEEAKGGIHAWPVASLFLSSTTDHRLKGLRSIVSKMRERMLDQPA